MDGYFGKQADTRWYCLRWGNKDADRCQKVLFEGARAVPRRGRESRKCEPVCHPLTDFPIQQIVPIWGLVTPVGSRKPTRRLWTDPPLISDSLVAGALRPLLSLILPADGCFPHRLLPTRLLVLILRQPCCRQGPESHVELSRSVCGEEEGTRAFGGLGKEALMLAI